MAIPPPARGWWFPCQKIMKEKFTQQDILSIIDLYISGKKQSEIASQFDCSQTYISQILIKNNIKTRTGKYITYNDLNVDFFKKINSEANAYFLGFLYSDGCVQVKENRYQISLKLKSNDQIIIEKFRDIMSPSSPVKITSNKNSPNTYSYFRINQKEICNQLMVLGCVPNKSLILKFPNFISKEFIPAFIRGYSDGDGSIYENKFKNKSYSNFIWKIISTKEFCSSVSDLLKNELNITCSQSLSRPKTNKITTTLSVGGNNQVEKVLDWIYKDATIYLPRKYDKYIEFKTYKNNKPFIEFKKLSLTEDDKTEIVSLYNSGKNSMELSKLFGASKPSILKILHDKKAILRPNAIGLNEKSEE